LTALSPQSQDFNPQLATCNRSLSVPRNIYFLKILRDNLHGAVLTAHGADIIGKRSLLPEGLDRVGVDGAGDLSLPVQGLAGLRHVPVTFEGLGITPGNICGMGSNAGNDDPSFTSFREGRPRCSEGVT